MNNKLKLIATFINKEDIVIDIGCDHAYLAIYLKENKLCKEIYASDISKNALDIANKNIKNKGLKIKTYLSDGFKDIPNLNINTAVISGVGANTILNIIKNSPDSIKKYIICSHNDQELLRKKMLNLKWYIKKESVIKEAGKYYNIILFTRDYKKINNKYLKYGNSHNIDYYNYLISKNKEILNNIPSKYILRKIKLIKEINDLKILIKRS